MVQKERYLGRLTLHMEAQAILGVEHLSGQSESLCEIEKKWPKPHPLNHAMDLNALCLQMNSLQLIHALAARC
jgi:hypothetical protein